MKVLAQITRIVLPVVTTLVGLSFAMAVYVYSANIYWTFLIGIAVIVLAFLSYREILIIASMLVIALIASYVVNVLDIYSRIGEVLFVLLVVVAIKLLVQLRRKDESEEEKDQKSN